MNILHKNGAMEELREHQNLLAQCYTTVVEIAKRAAVQDTTSSTKLEVREKKEKNYQIVRQQKGKASPPFLLLCFFCPFFFKKKRYVYNWSRQPLVSCGFPSPGWEPIALSSF